MNTYQIFIKTTEGWAYYSKASIFAQVYRIQQTLESRGYEVRLRKNGMWID